jgi:hypothetical protein
VLSFRLRDTDPSLKAGGHTLQYVTFAVRFASLCIVVGAIGTVAFMMYHGDIPQPDFRQILTQVAPSIGIGASGIAVLAVSLCFLLTAIAPLIYAPVRETPSRCL